MRQRYIIILCTTLRAHNTTAVIVVHRCNNNYYIIILYDITRIEHGAMAFLVVFRPFPCGNFRGGGQITIERYTINNNNNNARGPTEWRHVRRRRRRSRNPRTPRLRPGPSPFSSRPAPSRRPTGIL